MRQNLPHLVVPKLGVAEPFSPKGGGGKLAAPSRVKDREGHAQMLLKQLEPLVKAAEEAAKRDDLPAHENGIYVEVVGRPSEPLSTDSLERRKIELLSVTHTEQGDRATLFVPNSDKNAFSRVVESYRTKIDSRSKASDPLYRRLVDGIAEFRLAGLKDLWTDRVELFPQPNVSAFWETWLRPNTAARFKAFAEKLEIIVGDTGLAFPEAVAVHVSATPEQMAELVRLSLCASEVRRASVTAEFFVNLTPADQFSFSDDLLGRINYKANMDECSRICLLDTGVNPGHALLQPACSPSECFAVDAGWGEDDHHGHGTELAGIALLGDLVPILNSAALVSVHHRIESVKVIPPKGQNPHNLLGAVTRDAVDIVEVMRGVGRRIYCLASSTSDDTPHYGQPTSWSAALDQIAAGVGTKHSERRIVCVAAGNLRESGPVASDYLDRNDVAEIESPSQTWNGLSVGAFTDKATLTRTDLAGHTPFAPAGDLAPNSRTASWDGTWPIKPDIVLEGGNLAVDPADGRGWTTADLAVLTTERQFPSPVFSLSFDTSAAVAEAARFAAIISGDYPHFWPETVRALLVGSAQWTPAMKGHLPTHAQKGDYATLLKRYGHGVPDLTRARHSASNTLTLIVQDDIQPYVWSKKSGGPILNEMKLFRLPWPTAALAALQTAQVRMRVALSYFVEPNPSETQRNRKLRYASHGLRFRVKMPDEDDTDFRKRINKAALAAGEKVKGISDSSEWMIGPDHRDVGSLHCDTWIGPASNLARRGSIAVFPVGGWWKERPHLDKWASRARFALLINIDVGEADTDIYTPVETEISTPIAVSS